MKLDGKVAIVTGSASNIEKATAILFAQEGAKVVVTTRRNVEGAHAVVEEIIKAGGEAIFVQADLAKSNEIENLFNKTIKTYAH